MSAQHPFIEEALTFSCEQETLVGVLTRPLHPTDSGVVIVVGGPQTRVGSHRQFVLLARALAAAGHAVLRFDVRGMGDSRGATRSFEAMDDDVAAALDQLCHSVPGLRRVVLWGLCDAASAALLYCQRRGDARVTGLCLLNPWVRSEQSLAKTQVRHYYTQRLRQKEFWLKLLSGRVGVQALLGLWQKWRLSVSAPGADPSETQNLTFQDRMARGWKGFAGPILLILSGDDYTAREFLAFTADDAAWCGWSQHAALTRHDLPGVDHTFSNAQARAQVEQLTAAWLAKV